MHTWTQTHTIEHKCPRCACVTLATMYSATPGKKRLDMQRYLDDCPHWALIVDEFVGTRREPVFVDKVEWLKAHDERAEKKKIVDNFYVHPLVVKVSPAATPEVVHFLQHIQRC